MTLTSDQVSETLRLLASARQVVVAGHTSPDGDCVGAMLAFRLALQRRATAATLVLPDPVTEVMSFLPGVSEIVVGAQPIPACDLIIVPDCSDLGRLGALYDENKESFANVPLLNIDHHVSNARFGTVNIVDPAATAVCEQLFALFSELHIPVDVEIATCLLTGIITDTQTFRTPSTTPRALQVASLLAEAGAPIAQIADRVYNSRSVATLRLWGLALSDLKNSAQVVWTHLNEQMLRRAGATWDESEPLMSLLSTVRPGAVAVLFKEMPEGGVKVSLRSQGVINVAAIAAEFGGGGHVGAAGCSLSMPLELAETAVIGRVHEMLESDKQGEASASRAEDACAGKYLRSPR